MSRKLTTTDEPALLDGINRRRFLGALGAGTMIAAAGCVGLGDAEGEDGALHPFYGYASTSMDDEPPVEPDHEVALLIRPREGEPIPEFYFDPVGLSIEPGDVVQFLHHTPDHTVTAYHPRLGRTPRVPEEVPPLSSPVLGASTYWLYEFSVPGVYDLYCAPHEAFGMAMRLVVGEVSGPAAEPIETSDHAPNEPRPPVEAAARVLNDEALSPEAIVESGSVAWDDLAPESRALGDGGH